MGGRHSFIAKLINKKVAKLVTWFKTTQLTETDTKKLVSFSPAKSVVMRR